MSVSKALEFTDALMASTLQKAEEKGRPSKCSAGCCHCCYEPVYATKDEVAHAFAALSEAEQEIVRSNAKNWVERFKEADLATMPPNPERSDFRNLLRYRSAKIPCPFLDPHGLCRVYAQRPFGCRTHAALGSPKRCENQELRPKQSFILPPPDLMVKAIGHLIEDVPTALVEFDHLGVWLGEFAGVGKIKTAAAKTWIVHQEDS